MILIVAVGLSLGVANIIDAIYATKYCQQLFTMSQSDAVALSSAGEISRRCGLPANPHATI